LGRDGQVYALYSSVELTEISQAQRTPRVYKLPARQPSPPNLKLSGDGRWMTYFARVPADWDGSDMFRLFSVGPGEFVPASPDMDSLLGSRMWNVALSPTRDFQHMVVGTFNGRIFSFDLSSIHTL